MAWLKTEIYLNLSSKFQCHQEVHTKVIQVFYAANRLDFHTWLYA